MKQRLLLQNQYKLATPPVARRERGDAARNFMDRILRARVAGPGLVIIALPAPCGYPESLLDCFPHTFGVLWHSPHGPVVAGVEIAQSLALEGADRFERLKAWSRVVAAGITMHGCAPGPWPPPRFFGGFSFSPRADQGAPWRPFGDGLFVIPRWTYIRERERAFLMLAMRAPEIRLASKRRSVLMEYDMIIATLRADNSPVKIVRPPSPLPEVLAETIEQMPPEEWQRYVDGIRDGIRAGKVRKVVAARRTVFQLTQSYRNTDILSRLAWEDPGSTRFAFRRDGTTFLGITPETLFRKSGLSFCTHALAGTARVVEADDAVDTDQAERLLCNGKDRLEHSLVVQDIVERLAPLCSTVCSANVPQLRRVRNLWHLETPISGTLLETVSTAELLAALHPTPAVGGVPREAAIRYIEKREGCPRGWYTGGVGWFDLVGDAVFSVAIRCGLLAGERAYVFAGAGIVESSDAHLEYLESALKQGPLLRALGLDSRGCKATPRDICS
ncbi:MAG: isochorismate synthase [Gammaproteobacteria bacterium]